MDLRGHRWMGSVIATTFEYATTTAAAGVLEAVLGAIALPAQGAGAVRWRPVLALRKAQGPRAARTAGRAP